MSAAAMAGLSACHTPSAPSVTTTAAAPPVNHFNVIRPDNRVDALGFEAYWFGPGESIVAVRDGLVISVKVANIEGAWTDQDRADDIELANLIVPRAG